MVKRLVGPWNEKYHYGTHPEDEQQFGRITARDGKYGDWVPEPLTDPYSTD